MRKTIFLRPLFFLELFYLLKKQKNHLLRKDQELVLVLLCFPKVFFKWKRDRNIKNLNMGM